MNMPLNPDVKGVVVAGGTGSRLYPATLGVCKQLLPVYDKPMIYYPLSVLMLAGIRDVLIITTPDDQVAFERMLGDGSQLGIRISYAQQQAPQGVAQALLVAAPFVQGHPVCLVLGDNLFYGQGFSGMLQQAVRQPAGATVFAYPVNDVRQFGSVLLDDAGRVLSIEEKPQRLAAGYALTGLYFLDKQAVDMAATLSPSPRGELEIIDVLKIYLQQQQLQVQRLGRGFAWLDMGTCDAVLDAAHFVQTLEKRQGFKVACLEEIAWHQGWLDSSQLRQAAKRMEANAYGAYLSRLLQHSESDGISPTGGADR